MKTPSDLRLLALAILQQSPTEPKTRYQVMIEINQIISEILPPYSPGAVYHELKLLKRSKMIDIDHTSRVVITEPGLNLLHQSLLETPTPRPLLSLLVRVLTLLLLNNKTQKEKGLHKLQVEMIKFNQEAAVNERWSSDDKLSPITKLLQLGLSMRKAISAFVAQL